MNAADVLDWQRSAQSFEEIAGYRQANLRLTGRDRAERVRGAMVTPGFFRVLGIHALEDARYELTRVAASLASRYPDTNARRGVRVLRLADEIRVHHDLGFIVPVMFAMVGCVLLIACVNVTNVMLARTSTRRQEMAVDWRSGHPDRGSSASGSSNTCCCSSGQARSELRSLSTPTHCAFG